MCLLSIFLEAPNMVSINTRTHAHTYFEVKIQMFSCVKDVVELGYFLHFRLVQV